MSKESQTEVNLHYLDKVHATLFELGRRAHATVLLLAALSLGILLLVFGIITISPPVAILGINITAKQPVLLTLTACLLAALQVYLAALGSESARLRREITKGYSSLGFIPARERFEVAWSTIIYPDGSAITAYAIFRAALIPFAIQPIMKSVSKPVTSKAKAVRRMGHVLFRSLFLMGALFLGGVTFLFPVFAEVGAIVAAVNLQGTMTIWIWIAIVTLLALNGIALITAIHTLVTTNAENAQDTKDDFQPMEDGMQRLRDRVSVSSRLLITTPNNTVLLPDDREDQRSAGDD
jgi:hypothetical protein